VLFKALTRRGCRVVEAADGAAAIECYVRARADDDPFDVVILDLTVPGGMGGRETMARLLELDPEVRAIVSSGYSGDAAMAEHRELGFADVLAKPYRPRDMVAVVERVLREAES
jgi:CheY-like chemotaxis protein